MDSNFKKIKVNLAALDHELTKTINAIKAIKAIKVTYHDYQGYAIRQQR